MKVRHLCIWLIPVLMLALVIGCSSDDDNGTGLGDTNNTAEPPDLSVNTVTIPQGMTNSTDPMASMAVGYVQMANSFSAMMKMPPSSGKLSADFDGPPWTYTWSDPYTSITVTMTINETSTNYTWVWVINGNDGEYTYNNWTFMTAEVSKTDSSGTLIAYKPVTTEILMQWSWYFDAQGVYHVEVIVYGDDGGKILIAVNPDGSGSLEFYNKESGSYVLMMKVQWQADGSGEWWIYDNGTIASSGTWTSG